MPLNPELTNRMTCSSCGWTRVVDHMREYRGGHTHPEGWECHEMLVYENISLDSPEPWMFELETPYEPGMQNPNQ